MRCATLLLRIPRSIISPLYSVPTALATTAATSDGHVKLQPAAQVTLDLDGVLVSRGCHTVGSTLAPVVFSNVAERQPCCALRDAGMLPKPGPAPTSFLLLQPSRLAVPQQRFVRQHGLCGGLPCFGAVWH